MVHDTVIEGANQRSYLLRLWRTRETGALHATLITVGAQAAPRHFVDLEMLLAFLLDEWSPVPTQRDGSTHCTPDDAQTRGENQSR